MSLNYSKFKHKNSVLGSLQKYEEIFDGTLGKYTDSDHTIELQEDVNPYHSLILFQYQQF